LNIADEHVHNYGKSLSKLVVDIIKSKKVRIDNILGDGPTIVMPLFLNVLQQTMGSCHALIKVRKNAKANKKINNILRNLSEICLRNTIYKDGKMVS